MYDLLVFWFTWLAKLFVTQAAFKKKFPSKIIKINENGNFILNLSTSSAAG